jgi:S1-C subfamily serine protease
MIHSPRLTWLASSTALFILGGAAGIWAAGESVGLNFAIPINTAKEILPQLRAGSVAHGWIGLAARPLGKRQSIAAGLTAATEGLRVTGLAPGSPAEQAGLQVGDILLGVTDQPSVAPREIPHRIQNGKPGTTVRLRCGAANAWSCQSPWHPCRSATSENDPRNPDARPAPATPLRSRTG